ncbi:MAG: RNA polymerase sigma factor [Bacteroidales bacterium]
MAVQRDDPHDRQLLARLAAGEGEALGELYDRHIASLYRHACGLTKRREEADDLVQAVFVKLATIGAALLGVRKPASYLHRMLRTTWLDAQRRRVLRSEQSIESGPQSDGGVQPRLDSGLDTERALAVLSDDQREVVALHVLAGFSLRETGRITGVSTFTAASRYRLALARMRKFLEGR